MVPVGRDFVVQLQDVRIQLLWTRSREGKSPVVQQVANCVGVRVRVQIENSSWTGIWIARNVSYQRVRPRPQRTGSCSRTIWIERRKSARGKLDDVVECRDVRIDRQDSNACASKSRIPRKAIRVWILLRIRRNTQILNRPLPQKIARHRVRDLGGFPPTLPFISCKEE